MDDSRPAMPLVRTRLFIMMVLEFFVWGTWYPLVFKYLPGLGFTTTQQSLILSAFPIAAIVGMFFSSQFADRNFAGEKFLAFSALAGGLALVGLGFVKGFWPFFFLMLVHCLLYVPTISITNSIAFAHLKDPVKEFGIVRMGGTIGWILAAWPFVFIFVDWAAVKAANKEGFVDWIGTVLKSGLTGPTLTEATRWTYIVGGISSMALAAFSLFLPHTPPKKAVEPGTEKLAWLEATKLLKHPFVLLLWIITFVDAFVLNCYFNWTAAFLENKAGIPGNWTMPVMSIGQVSEILTMAVLGLVLKKLGWRTTMVLGILGHTVRFGVYAFFPTATWLIAGVQVLHGICYAFFFATVYIFVDAFFPKDVRSSAQGLFNVMILGIGPAVGSFACPWLMQTVFTKGNVTDFRSLFLLPCLIALAIAVVLALFFKPPAAAGEGQAEAAKSPQ
jgi:nucleoside transporter